MKEQEQRISTIEQQLKTATPDKGHIEELEKTVLKCKKGIFNW